ncbi:MAG: uL30 family ribosomal protein [Deltaproteobacteria bacterium]|nr:uL30 family ribosomal protein [Deltaproteobacteria bacterium]
MKVKVTLLKGLAGKSKHIIATAHSLGLMKRGRSKIFEKIDRPIFGKLQKLKDYIQIEFLN